MKFGRALNRHERNALFPFILTKLKNRNAMNPSVVKDKVLQGSSLATPDAIEPVRGGDREMCEIDIGVTAG